MGILVSAHRLSKSFTASPLFSGLSFALASGDRTGLIGPNGAGKSTLLRILSSQLALDSGTLSFQRGLKVGFLEQVPVFSEKATILSSLLEGDAPSQGGQSDWSRHALALEYISRLELDAFGADARIDGLSGGWKKRVALARELVKTPDLLLLDEPTNHLDVESIMWLENLLASASFATLTITHDRLFLQRISNRIMELDPRHKDGLLVVHGDYATYLGVREQLVLAQEKREIILKNTLRRETEWLRQGAKARTTKQQARIQRAGELQEAVEDLSTRNRIRTAKLDFQSSGRAPKKLIDARGISKKYGDKLVFSALDLMITPGTRIGLMGPNGAGKSTLIRVLIGLEEASSGAITRSEQLSVAYFDQTREALDPDVTVAKTICPSGDHVEYRGARVHIRGYLDRFLFTQEQLDLAVGKLSGGEQSRLLIARLMLTRANLLVLDEPTNDLDMATLGVLEECLLDFSGAVLLVTHDRYFLDQAANKILAFAPRPDGKLLPFAGLAQWERWHATQKKPAVFSAKTTQTKAVAAKKRKLSFNEQRELDSMESDICKAEELLARLGSESVLPENTCNAALLAELTEQMAAAQAEVERLYRRWSELEDG